MRFFAKFLPGLLLTLSSLTFAFLLIKQPSEAQGTNGQGNRILIELLNL